MQSLINSVLEVQSGSSQGLTHLSMNEMANILQMIIWSTFLVFLSKFHWRFLPGVYLDNKVSLVQIIFEMLCSVF